MRKKKNGDSLDREKCLKVFFFPAAGGTCKLNIRSRKQVRGKELISIIRTHSWTQHKRRWMRRKEKDFILQGI